MRLTILRCFVGLLFLLDARAQESTAFSDARDTFRASSLGKVEISKSPTAGRELGLLRTNATPYDRYFGSVRAVLAVLHSKGATMADACHLMKVGHSFRYVTRDRFRPDPPELTEAQRAGDCKSKALWLFDSLADGEALFVIGKAERNMRTSHAWVYWRNEGRWWILDCTERTDPIAAESVSKDRYIPHYAFAKSGAYRHHSVR